MEKMEPNAVGLIFGETTMRHLAMQNFSTRLVALTTLLGLSSLLWVLPVHAQVRNQPQTEGQATQQSTQQPKDVSDNDLQAFAKVYIEVQKIKESHQADLKAAQEPEQVQKLEQKANSEITKAMEKQGFTPETYAQTLRTINSDKTLTQKALELVQKERAD
jgi:hypothetical protein